MIKKITAASLMAILLSASSTFASQQVNQEENNDVSWGQTWNNTKAWAYAPEQYPFVRFLADRIAYNKISIFAAVSALVNLKLYLFSPEGRLLQDIATLEAQIKTAEASHQTLLTTANEENQARLETADEEYQTGLETANEEYQTQLETADKDFRAKISAAHEINNELNDGATKEVVRTNEELLSTQIELDDANKAVRDQTIKMGTQAAKHRLDISRNNDEHKTAMERQADKHRDTLSEDRSSYKTKLSEAENKLSDAQNAQATAHEAEEAELLKMAKNLNDSRRRNVMLEREQKHADELRYLQKDFHQAEREISARKIVELKKKLIKKQRKFSELYEDFSDLMKDIRGLAKEHVAGLRSQNQNELANLALTVERRHGSETVLEAPPIDPNNGESRGETEENEEGEEPTPTIQLKRGDTGDGLPSNSTVNATDGLPKLDFSSIPRRARPVHLSGRPAPLSVNIPQTSSVTTRTQLLVSDDDNDSTGSTGTLRLRARRARTSRLRRISRRPAPLSVNIPQTSRETTLTILSVSDDENESTDSTVNATDDLANPNRLPRTARPSPRVRHLQTIKNPRGSTEANNPNSGESQDENKSTRKPLVKNDDDDSSSDGSIDSADSMSSTRAISKGKVVKRTKWVASNNSWENDDDDSSSDDSIESVDSKSSNRTIKKGKILKKTIWLPTNSSNSTITPTNPTLLDLPD